MTSVEPLNAASEGLRNRAKQQKASAVKKRDKDNKDDNNATKVLGRTPDGTGKCSFLTHI